MKKNNIVLMIFICCALSFIDAQTYMTLEPYKTVSCQLDTIIDIMMETVKVNEIVHVAAYKKGNDGYVVTAYFEGSDFLKYSSHLGYLQRGKITFLFEESDIIELLEKDITCSNKSLLCKKLRKLDPNNFTYDPNNPYIVGVYCGQDWNFIIDKDGVRMIEGVKDGQIYYNEEEFIKFGKRIIEKLYYDEKNIKQRFNKRKK